ncbi:unnamed protein product [Durusdinium trenchii]|uniref:Transmembrane protein n=1 Tax=Durusdinium trenchii TaxID=1381693 RepID=A0ABP0Q5H2_9DINO
MERFLRTVIRGDRGAPPFTLSPETATVAETRTKNLGANSSLNAPWPKELGGETGGTTVTVTFRPRRPNSLFREKVLVPPPEGFGRWSAVHVERGWSAGGARVERGEEVKRHVQFVCTTNRFLRRLMWHPSAILQPSWGEAYCLHSMDFTSFGRQEAQAEAAFLDSLAVGTGATVTASGGFEYPSAQPKDGIKRKFTSRSGPEQKSEFSLVFERGEKLKICGPPVARWGMETRRDRAETGRGKKVVICFLAGSSIAQILFAQLQPVLAFLGERIHILELLGLLGWGLWIVHIGLPMLGWSFVVISVLPGWPFAVYDLVQMGWKEGRRRVMMAMIGLHHLQEYHGSAASPEMELFSSILAKVPQMGVISMASAEGRDVLMSGWKENGFFRFVTLFYAFLSGLSIAVASYACVDAVEQPSHEALGIEEALASQIDGWISRLVSYLIHAIDTLTVVTVVGAVGAHSDREAFWMWLFSLWLVTGLLPALVAPPPMPTLRPALPKHGLKAFCHKFAVSILLVASPPTEFMPLLRVTKQRVWAAACLVRAVWVLASAMVVPTLRRPLFAGLEVIHVVVLGALGIALVTTIINHHWFDGTNTSGCSCMVPCLARSFSVFFAWPTTSFVTYHPTLPWSTHAWEPLRDCRPTLTQCQVFFKCKSKTLSKARPRDCIRFKMIKASLRLTIHSSRLPSPSGSRTRQHVLAARRTFCAIQRSTWSTHCTTPA